MICYVCTIVQHAWNVLVKRLHLCLLGVLGLMSVSCQFSQFVLFYDLIPFMYWSHLTDLQCVLVHSCECVWTPSTAHPSRNPSQGSQFFLYCSLRGIWLSGCFESPSASNRNVFKLCFFYNPHCPEGFHTSFVFEEQNLFMSCTRWAPF